VPIIFLWLLSVGNSKIWLWSIISWHEIQITLSGISLIWLKVWNERTRKDVRRHKVTDKGEVKNKTCSRTLTDALHSEITSLLSPFENKGRLAIANS
jgi:hypothetical protein